MTLFGRSTIPRECRKLVKIHNRLELSEFEEWEGFKIKGRYLELPTGESVSPQQVVTGVALLQIQSELEIKTSMHHLKQPEVYQR